MRITITVSDDVVKQIDSFAKYTGQSRSSVCGGILEISTPILDEMRSAFDLIKSGADTSSVINSLRQMTKYADDEISKLEQETTANPSYCNNGGQVVASEGANSSQRHDFKGVSPDLKGGSGNA